MGLSFEQRIIDDANWDHQVRLSKKEREYIYEIIKTARKKKEKYIHVNLLGGFGYKVMKNFI